MALIIEILFIIALLFILIANYIIRVMAKDLKKEPNKTNLSGFEVARIISSKLALEEPHIIKKNGNFLDHYNYERNVIKLSPEVFDGTDIYAAIIALNIALETAPERKNVAIGHKFNSFIIISSYLILIIGAFLNKANIIHFGLILFIIALIIEILLLNLFGHNEEEVNKIYDAIKKENIIRPFDENKDNMLLLMLINIARLPYSFINYFR